MSKEVKQANQYTSDERDQNRINHMRVAYRVIKLADGRKKYRTENPFRHTEATIKKVKQKKQCVVCEEKRALEFCHIVPVAFLKQTPKEFADKAKGIDNGVILCKTHHWCFDHKKLSDEELEKVYQSSKDFINNVLKFFINQSYSYPEGSNPTARQKTILNNYVDWMKWSGKVFFIKNSDL